MCAEACAVYTMKKVRQTVYLSMHVMCSLLCDTRLYKPFTQLMIHINLHNKYMNKKGVELALKVFEADEDHDNLELGTLREISVRTYMVIKSSSTPKACIVSTSTAFCASL